MFSITKEFSFDAAHWLPYVPEGHKCGRLHGHTYTVIVELAVEGGPENLDGMGFVVDYGDLNPIKQHLDAEYDHRNLNDWMTNPTAENIAYLLFQTFKPGFPQLVSVTVKETPKTSATYYEG